MINNDQLINYFNTSNFFLYSDQSMISKLAIYLKTMMMIFFSFLILLHNSRTYFNFYRFSIDITIFYFAYYFLSYFSKSLLYHWPCLCRCFNKTKMIARSDLLTLFIRYLSPNLILLFTRYLNQILHQ